MIAAYPQVDSEEGEQLTGLLAALRSGHPEPPARARFQPMTDQEFESRLANTLARLFGRFTQGTAPEGAPGGDRDPKKS